jgi:hypothetical protein
VAWLPLVFVGAIMFWTVALGLGGLSFVLVNDRAAASAVDTPATAVEPKPGTEAVGTGGAEAIPVQMEESQESEDVNDNAGAVTVPVDQER